MRPASSMSTLTPAVASWKAAMPPAAPLPTTMTSQVPDPGLMVEARRRDSARLSDRSMSSVGSAGISGLRRLPAPGAILAVHGLASDELEQDLVALVAELLVHSDLGGVVAVDGGLLGGHEEGLQRRALGLRGLGVLLVATGLGEQLRDLLGGEVHERRRVARRGLGVEHA